jgi:hypothetical protein
VDKALAAAYAREEMVTNDDEGSLNPFVLKVISAYPTNGTYQYHCSWTPREYDIYNGVTEDLWYRGMVVAKAYPDGSRVSYCCGFTFEVFVRAMQLRNIQNGLDLSRPLQRPATLVHRRHGRFRTARDRGLWLG